MIVTLGGRFGGYGFYLLKGKPVFLYNFMDLERFRWESSDALAAGKHTLVFDFKYNGPASAKGEPASSQWTARRLRGSRLRTPFRSS
jgi:arylsulfatase